MVLLSFACASIAEWNTYLFINVTLTLTKIVTSQFWLMSDNNI